MNESRSGTRSLSQLAETVADEFQEYRDPDRLKDVSIVIDDGTLIVHTTGDELADSVEAVLQNQGAWTERERYDESDIRILAIVS